jgi:hypothetical protein
MVVLILILFRKLHIVFHNVCTNLHSQQQRTRVAFSLHPHQHLLPFIFWTKAILTDMRRYHIVVLISIFLMITVLNIFFHIPVGSLNVFLRNVCWGPSLIFIWVICFLAIELSEFLMYFEGNLLSDVWFENILSHFIAYLFTFTVSFLVWCTLICLFLLFFLWHT